MYKNQSGQIGLVVLLIMTTMLTVGLGAITRSTNDLRITAQELESSQLFNAAEAGVELALGAIEQGSPPGSPVSITVDNSNVTYSVSEIRDFELTVEENSHLFVDVTRASPQASDQLTVTWGTTADCTEIMHASLEVLIFSSNGDPVLIDGFYRCQRNDGLKAATAGSIASISIPLDNNDVLVGLRPLYRSAAISVTAEGGWSLPVQGYTIRSTATSPDSDETKVIVVDRMNDMPASSMMFGVLSGTTLLMN